MRTWPSGVNFSYSHESADAVCRSARDTARDATSRAMAMVAVVAADALLLGEDRGG
uniref:Uncharacterized protein n=1 Tax=Arundo donax TaxID=35708 RepID=A0A0A9DZI5_ARUDO